MEKPVGINSAKSVPERERSAVDEIGAALYVNYFEMGHNPFEFFVVLGQFHPGAGNDDGKIVIHSRIALAPPYAKMLSDLLARTVHEHEAEFGPIAAVAPPADPIEAILAPLGEFEARARALRAGSLSADQLNHR
jgi:hypothetical protein